jgi:hypothetical protein
VGDLVVRGHAAGALGDPEHAVFWLLVEQTRERYPEHWRESVGGIALWYLLPLVGLNVEEGFIAHEVAFDALVRLFEAEAAKLEEAEGEECLVTLLQITALCNRSKRTGERWKGDASFPLPRVEGGGGNPAEWAWSEVRPWLEKQCRRKLPECFPADRFVAR